VERHIVVNQEIPLMDIARILHEKFGDDYPFPRREAPKFLFWLIAPMYGRTRNAVKRNVGFRIRFDASRARKALGISYLPLEQTVKEHFQQIVAKRFAGPKLIGTHIAARRSATSRPLADLPVSRADSYLDLEFSGPT
jgi:hypothetical protein